MAAPQITGNDPTGMYDMARRTHEMAKRNGAIKPRVTEPEATIETVVFAEFVEDDGEDEPAHSALLDVAPMAEIDRPAGDRAAIESGVEPPLPIPAKPRTNGWVPERPVVSIDPAPPPSRPGISVTDLVPLSDPPSSARIFPSLDDPRDRVPKSWPDQTSPFFEEVDADVTHPRTPTGRKAKRGPKLPFFGGLSYAEYSKELDRLFGRVNRHFSWDLARLQRAKTRS